MVRQITPKMLVQKWGTLPSRLAVNAWNFETIIGDKAQYIFKKSFYLRHFNSSGEFAWRPRRNQKPHPILDETGQLKNSINWKHLSGSASKGVRVFTDPSKFNYANHRNPYVCYAAIHNAPDNTYKYGNSGVPSVQRKFIGHSSYLDQEILKYSYKIFDGFPK